MNLPFFARWAVVMVTAPWLAMAAASYASSLPQVSLCIAGHPAVITAEVAATDAARARGLMMRESLEEHQGMWFRYNSERSGDNGFWMYNTWIPLDIAYLDSQQRIVKIIQMQPCDSIDPTRCPVYAPKVPYQHALEMNLGYFSQYNIALGTHVTECKSQE
jgi:uncharacterized membrane protein (UPF0127 family)